MPSLSEYIRSLKSYNPGITDKSIKIYLLKDGWNIDEIEKTFKEINGVTPLPENSVASTAPVAPIASTASTAPANPVSPITQTKAIEVQPEELSKTEIKKSIAYPTFEQVQQKINPTIENIVNSTPVVTPVSAPAPVAAQPATYTVQRPTTTPAPAMTPAPASVSVQTPTSAAVPVSVPEPITITPKQEFGAPVASYKPNFSYKDIIGDMNQEHVPVGWPSVPSVTIPETQSANTKVNTAINKDDFAKDLTHEAPVPLLNKKPSNDTLTTGQMAGAVVPTMTSAQAEAYAKIMGEKRSENLPMSASVPNNINTQIQTGIIPPVQTPAPSSQYQAPSTPYNPLATAVNSSQPSTVTMSAQQSAKTREIHSQIGGKIVKMLFWFVLILVLFGGGGYVYANYIHGVYVFVKEPFAKDDFINGFAKSIATIDTAAYEASVTFKTSEREASIQELDLSKYSESSSDITDVIPADASFGASISGIYNKNKDSNDGKFGFKGSYAGDGVSINLDVESVKVGKNLYVRINTFPSFFFDISKVKDKWVMVTEEDFENRFGSSLSSFLGTASEDSFVNSNSESDEADTSDAKKQYMAALQFASKKQIFEVINNPVKKVDAGNIGDNKRVIYEYEVKPNLANIITFAKELPAHMKAEFGDKSLFKDNPEAIKELETKEFTYYFNYFRENTKTIIGIDSKGYLAYIDVLNKTAPKGSKFNKQLETGFKISLNNVNGKNDVYVPTTAIPFIDAYSLVTGKSKEDLLFDQQAANVDRIRESIKEYTRYTGTTPLSLDDLRRSTAELVIASTTFDKSKDDKFYYLYEFPTSTRPLYAGTLKSAFSGQNLTYERVDNISYKLIYDIKLPSVPSDSSRLLYGAIAGYDYLSSAKPSGLQMMYLKFAEGVNTATEILLSKEADSKKSIDTDKDRVSDAFELYVGTDINKSDTDGDSQSDYTEIRNGTNPKGTGN